MTYDQLRDKWDSQTNPVQIAVDKDLLLKMVRKEKRTFECLIFWRDVREAGGSFILSFVFLYFCLKDKSWPMFVMALACWFVAAFMVIDRRIQKRKSGECSNTILSYAQHSLQQVNHQIWLLKNVLWWYLLPFSVGIGIIFGLFLWEQLLQGNTREVLLIIRQIALGLLLYYGIYKLNQWAVKKYLLPRRLDLEELLDNLIDNQPTAND